MLISYKRKYGKCQESVELIAYGCSYLPKERHDTLARVVHCKSYDLPFSGKWHEHSPAGITENEEVKILWDFAIQTYREVNHRRPDITVHDENNKKVLIKDIALRGDSSVEGKLRERETAKIPRLSKGNT